MIMFPIIPNLHPLLYTPLHPSKFKHIFLGTQQVLNTVPRSASGRRSHWGDDPREELYKQLVEQHEERDKELFQENDHLKHWYVCLFVCSFVCLMVCSVLVCLFVCMCA